MYRLLLLSCILLASLSALQCDQQNNKIHVVFEGLLNVLQSQALINREVCVGLAELSDIDLSIVTVHQTQYTAPEFDERVENLQPLLNRRLPKVDISVRHQWFADVNSIVPNQGRFVLWHPWEFCSLQTSWMHVFQNLTDEIWVYSHHNRDCYIRSGISGEKVHVIPLGVDPQLFFPGAAPPYELKTKNSNKFLYVGGIKKRKGFEVFSKDISAPLLVTMMYA